MSKNIRCEYRYDDKFNIDITKEGFKVVEGIGFPERVGYFKCDVDDNYSYWTPIATN